LAARKAKRLKWGISGLGKFAEGTFIPTLQMVKRSQLHSVYSSSQKRSKFIAEKFAVPNYFHDFENFLKSDFEALYIASANSDHHWQVIKAAEAGKHILCEKPMALDLKEAQEMVDACKKNNVQLAVNYVYRFHPLVVKAKEVIDKGMLGKLVSIGMNFNIDYPPTDNFRYEKARGGGALRDLGSHMIDLIRFFGGDVEQVKGYVDKVVYKSEVDDFASGILKLDHSGYGYFNVSFSTVSGFNRIEILGYNGSISIEKLIARRNVPSKLSISLKGEYKKAFRKRANKLYYLLKSVQKSFLRNETPQVTGEDGLINMKIMEQLENR
jgi:predicted dehydrogenase